MAYGNQLADDSLTFWLSDNEVLKISALEQVEFLKRLYLRQLSVSKKTYEIMQDIMLDEQTPLYRVYAKTGAAAEPRESSGEPLEWNGHGWYMGYLVKDSQTWFFATNIKIKRFDDLAKRKQITLDVFKQ